MEGIMIIRIFSFTAIIVFCLISVTHAQVSSEIWLRLHESIWSTYSERMLFGDYINATYGQDSLNPTIVERVMPPVEGYFIVWENIPGRLNTRGLGFVYFDFRGYIAATQIDTFVLGFFDPYNITADWALTWPDSMYLRLRCDSMFMVDPTGQIAKVNMFTQDSLYLHAPGSLDLPITRLRICKYGCKFVDGVASTPMELPAKYSLAQNYPNPFNPTTQITYSVPIFSNVILNVYDILGRTVATLVNEKKSPGEYTVQWNAADVPSGVYFYRIVAGEFVLAKKMVVLH
jgi:hypothetical protein